ncbi:MAG: RNA-binding protein [Oscillospiraceae bacterium]|nr:RNA-binding protein [Oscillospiraceae bacterium]
MSKFVAPSVFSDDDRILVRHILDLARQSETSGRPRFSAFLDERQSALCESALKREHVDFYSLNGGYDGALRVCICFDPCGYGIDDALPFTPVVFNYRAQDKPSHRDFLGSIMALEIKREMIGDILVGDTKAVVFVYNTALSLVSDIRKIGKVGVSVSFDFNESDIPPQLFDEITSTVASLRLDAVLSVALRISREKASELIKAKGVLLNRVMTFNTSAKVDECDTFSLRGFGKFELAGIGGNSKKDRIFITIKKFK